MDPVLLIDDETDNLEAMRRLLRSEFNLSTTTSPLEGLKWAIRDEYHVIVSDQKMPEMTGVDFFEKVKTISPRSTRILLTGYADIETVVNAINLGQIYRYVPKPWEPNDLRLTLRQANEAFLLKKEVDEKRILLTQSNDELKKALDELKNLDRAKARFLSLVSHELNTPLTVILSFTSLLEDGRASLPKELESAVGAIRDGVSRLSSIVSEVLTYVKLELGESFLKTDFDFEKETKLLKKDFEKILKQKNVIFKIERNGSAISKCDPSKMRLALRKLLESTLNFSPRDETVNVIIEGDKNHFIYSVSRGGEPLTEKVFNPLEVQGHELNHHRDLGLSLAMTKLIIEGHGATLKIENSSDERTILKFILQPY